MNDRLQQFLDVQGLTPTRFADAIGVQRSNVSHILLGRNKPGFDFIEKLLTRYPELNADWFILGKGSMYKEMHTPSLFPEEKVSHGRVDLAESEDESVEYAAAAKRKYADRQAVEDTPLEAPPKRELAASRKPVKVLVCYNDGSFEAFDKL